MNKKPVMNDDCKWIINTVIPQAQEIGCRMAAEKLRSEKPIAEPQKEPTAPLSRESIAERLDNIILECLLMKKELIQTK